MSFKKRLQKCFDEKAAEVFGLDLFGFVKVTIPPCKEEEKKVVVDDIVELTQEHWSDVIGEPTKMTCGVEHYHSRVSQGNIGDDCDPHIHIHFFWDTNKNPINSKITEKAMDGEQVMKKFLSNWVTAWKKRLKAMRPQYDWSAKKGMISVRWNDTDACEVDCMKYPLKQYGHEKNMISDISDRFYIGYTDVEFEILKQSAVDWWQMLLGQWQKKKKHANEIRVSTFWEDCKIWLKKNAYSENADDKKTVCLGILRFHALKSRDVSFREIVKKYNLWLIQEVHGADETMAAEIAEMVV